MNGRSLINVGGVCIVIGGLITAGYITTDASFGFILPVLYHINVTVGIFAGGLIALSKPKYAPVGAALSGFLAFDTFFISYYDPLWAAATLVGSVVVLAGWGLTHLSSRSQQPTTA
jgi:hypothetical protein